MLTYTELLKQLQRLEMQNNTIPRFDDIKNAFGGRPKEDKMVRLAYYLSKEESEKLKALSRSMKVPVSRIIRDLVQKRFYNDSCNSTHA